MQQNDPYFDDEVDLKELFKTIWEGRKLIIKITAIFAISSIAVSLLLTNYYQSGSLMVARNNTENQSMLAQYSGLASMAGVNLSVSGDNKALEAMELIKSRKFVKHLLTFENILPSIMAPKNYNSSSKELLFDQKIYDSETGIWKINKPSYLEAHEVYLDSLISISQDKFNGFILIKVEHISPVFAKEFLELIIREANVLLRKRDMEESSQAIEYLKSELSKTSFVEIQESINSLIEAQLEKQMLAKINEAYILIEIDPPFIAEKKSKPSRLLICVLGTIIGSIFGVGIVLISHYSSSKSDTNINTSI